MYIKDVRTLEDFTAYVLINGYDFPCATDTKLGMYWMWKSGAARIHKIGKTTTFLERRYGFKGYEVVFETDATVQHRTEQRSGNTTLILVKYNTDCQLLAEMLGE
jgi:hypothetical protein